MNEKEAREIIQWAKECNKRDPNQDRLYLPTVSQARGYLEAVEKAKGLEEFIRECILKPYKDSDILSLLQWIRRRGIVVIAEWEKEK